MMKREWTSYLVIVFLLGLLVVLATLQYRWLGQISNAESKRLSTRLADDTERFADDFDQAIQKSFLALQVDGKELEGDGLRNFLKRVMYVRQKSPVKGLLDTVYYVSNKTPDKLMRFDENNARMEPVSWPSELESVRGLNKSEVEHMTASGDALLLPVFESGRSLRRVVTTSDSDKGGDDKVEMEELIGQPVKAGFLVITLNRGAITKELLPGLVNKYFSKDGAGSYELSITEKDGKSVFSTHGKSFTTGDSKAKLFRLKPENVFVFSRQDTEPVFTEGSNIRSRVIFGEKFRSRTEIVESNEPGLRKRKTAKTLTVDLSKPDITGKHLSIFDSKDSVSDGPWLLSVRHTAGSLDTFIANTRYRNLAVSFGILGVLAAGMVLIVISTHRARSLAQKQLDFVSSISHEFRTPLAVIYSAGENITDGVISDGDKLSKYGELIKREGSKLSRMVEQVLAYAGANAHKRKYEFRDTDINSVIAEAISECDPLISDSGVEISTDLSAVAEPAAIDSEAMRSVFQNLIANGIKYSNSSKRLKVTSRVGKDHINVSFEDHGIGIAKSDLKQIFEPFYRAAHVVDEQISGNGLGLSLVREIVRAHGGSIDVKSVVGEGSIFTVKIPVERQKN